MAYTLLGQDFVPPDVRAKVTGEAKYAEDFRADGMVFCRLLHSTMPHARVTRIDASEALAMDGVVAVLTATSTQTPAPNSPADERATFAASHPIGAAVARRVRDASTGYWSNWNRCLSPSIRSIASSRAVRTPAATAMSSPVAGTWRQSSGRPPISPPSRKDNSRPVSPRTSGRSAMSRGIWPKPRS